MTVTMPSAQVRGWRSSDLVVGYAVKYYSVGGKPRCDVLVPSYGIPAKGCEVMLGGLRRIRAPKDWDPSKGIDFKNCSKVLIARQPDDLPWLVVGVEYSPLTPADEHEADGDLVDTTPALSDEVLSDNGGTRTFQRENGDLVVDAVGNILFKLTTGTLQIGGSNAKDNVSLASSTIEVTQDLRNRVDALELKLNDVIARMKLLVDAVVIGVGTAYIPQPIALGPYLQDLDDIRCELVRVASGAPDDL